jgi:alkanesulfonate monooxygenase SsuD/methylene tetrahydromethanopterin reductase-like flavin-dependent oxidoreductase (luciferase family)
MLRLSGEIADGVIPGGAGASAKATQRSIRSIYDGAKRAGRSTSEVDIHQFVISSVSDNSERAKESVKEFVAWMIGSGGSTNKSLLLDEFDTKDVLPIVQAINKNDPKGASRYVTSRMVDTYAAAGTPKEFRQRIMSYVDAGVKCVVIVPTGSQADINVTIEEASRLVDSERRY